MSCESRLSFAGLLISIKTGREPRLPDCFRPFICADRWDAPADIEIRAEVGMPSDLPKELHGSNGALKRDGEAWQYYRLPDGQDVVRRERAGKDLPYRCDIYIPKSFEEGFFKGGNWLLYLAIERALLKFGRVFIHASVVIDGERAYIFTAPSGGGKSTQARLWAEHVGAEQLNGDKVILHIDGGRLYASGGPVAGSSGIYVDRSAEVGGIYRIHKAEREALLPMTSKNALLTLYSGAVKSNWDEEFNQKLLSLLVEMSDGGMTEFFDFYCTPTYEAVKFIREKRNTP